MKKIWTKRIIAFAITLVTLLSIMPVSVINAASRHTVASSAKTAARNELNNTGSFAAALDRLMIEDSHFAIGNDTND